MTVLMPASARVPQSLARREPPGPFDTRADDFDLTASLRLLRRRLPMIAIITVVLTALALPFILQVKPVYHAASRLMIHSPLASTLEASQVSPLNITSETERLLSRPIAERVIKELDLADREEFNPALRSPSILGSARAALRSIFVSDPDGADRAEGMERIIPEYYHALDVHRDAGSDVIQIGFDSQDRELAAAVPNKLLDIYLEERKVSAQSGLNAAMGWVQQRILEQQGRVSAAREAAERYRQAVGAVSNDAQAEDIRSVADLTSRLADIERGRAEVVATISALETKDDEIIRQVAVPDAVGAIQRKLSTQNKELDELLQTYGERADVVIQLRADMLKVRADLDFELDRYLQAQRAKLMTFERQEGSTKIALADARERLSRSTLAQIELTRLERVADAEQATLDKFEDQDRALAAQTALPAVEVEVLSAASVPLLPQGRGRLFYLIGTLLASLSIAVTAAFLREMMDNSVRSHEQLEGIPNIAPAGLLPTLSERGGKKLPLMFGNSEGGAFAEAVRSTAIALRHANGGRFPDSILITSAHSGEGKTLMALSLAIELTAVGQNVLLVDGDLRHGDLGSLLKSGAKPGLNEFLTGQAKLADIIHHHSNKRIDFIPRGDPALHQRPNFADIAEIAQLAKANGRVLIVDSAPVLASADTTYLAGLTDMTLLVVQWAQTTRRAVESAVHRLEAASKSETLIAVNNVNVKKHKMYGFRDAEALLR